MSYRDRLADVVATRDSLLCVGLDPVLDKLPRSVSRDMTGLRRFLLEIVEAVSPFAAAFKPNFAYFEVLGAEGWQLLEEVVLAVPAGCLVIGDAKRGDVGHTAELYARTVLENVGCDAVTVSPYMGYDAVEPFLRDPSKGVYLLCLTSNEGARDFQMPRNLFLEVARAAKLWNKTGNLGLVVGATHAEQVAAVREASGAMPFLVPGVGAQGGDLERNLLAAQDGTNCPVLINSSRGILYASSQSDYLDAAAEAAQALRDQIRQVMNAGTANSPRL